MKQILWLIWEVNQVSALLRLLWLEKSSLFKRCCSSRPDFSVSVAPSLESLEILLGFFIVLLSLLHPEDKPAQYKSLHLRYRQHQIKTKNVQRCSTSSRFLSENFHLSVRDNQEAEAPTLHQPNQSSGWGKGDSRYAVWFCWYELKQHWASLKLPSVLYDSLVWHFIEWLL